MTLHPGSRLGTYEITGALGAGGMGEVYRARDTRLKREVAIKILPETFARHPDRVARFQREAEVLASLNHPYIAAIYDLPESAGSHFLVLELVEGETLADRIANGPIPAGEALPLAKQIAEALEAAHEKGIVHRDLKPANIKITRDGTVKVLDFGLAKILADEESEPANSQSPTKMSVAASESGFILGTAAYMSPEQARGKAIDKRADIWAFGAVLSEMLTGRAAFAGETVSDTIAAILTREIEWSALPPDVPESIRHLLRRCLQRDASQRLRDIGDARIEIAETLTARPHLSPTAAVERKPRRTVLIYAVLAFAALLGAALGFYLRPQPPAALSWTGIHLTGPDVAWTPQISPDGKTLAFQVMVDGLSQVAVMDPESGSSVILTKDRTHGYVSTIRWSRDGTLIYYTRQQDLPRGIFSIPKLGGEERPILDNAAGAELLPDGSLLISKINSDRQWQIYRYWPQDGREAPYPKMISQGRWVFRLLPDGSRAVMMGRSADEASSDSGNYFYVLDIATGNPTKVATEIRPEAESFDVTADGTSIVVPVRNGDLYRIVQIFLDPGRPSHTLLNVQQVVRGLSAGPDGSIYLDQISRPVETLRFGLSGGAFERVNTFSKDTIQYGSMLYLPDGRTLAPASVGGRSRLLVAAPGKAPTPFAGIEEESDSPTTLLGNDRVAFVAGSGNDRRIAIASVQDGRILNRLQTVKAGTISQMASSVDGKTLFYVDSGAIWNIPAEGGQPRKIHAGNWVAVMPDGSLIAQLIEADKGKWVRTNLEGTMEQPVVFKSAFRASGIGPSAVGRDGRIVVALATSWFFTPAIFDPRSGSVQLVPVDYDADFLSPAWTPDGKLICGAYQFQSSVWRFRPIQ